MEIGSLIGAMFKRRPNRGRRFVHVSNGREHYTITRGAAPKKDAGAIEGRGVVKVATPEDAEKAARPDYPYRAGSGVTPEVAAQKLLRARELINGLDAHDPRRAAFEKRFGALMDKYWHGATNEDREKFRVGAGLPPAGSVEVQDDGTSRIEGQGDVMGGETRAAPALGGDLYRPEGRRKGASRDPFDYLTVVAGSQNAAGVASAMTDGREPPAASAAGRGDLERFGTRFDDGYANDSRGYAQWDKADRDFKRRMETTYGSTRSFDAYQYLASSNAMLGTLPLASALTDEGKTALAKGQSLTEDMFRRGANTGLNPQQYSEAIKAANLSLEQGRKRFDLDKADYDEMAARYDRINSRRNSGASAGSDTWWTGADGKAVHGALGGGVTYQSRYSSGPQLGWAGGRNLDEELRTRRAGLQHVGQSAYRAKVDSQYAANENALTSQWLTTRLGYAQQRQGLAAEKRALQRVLDTSFKDYRETVRGSSAGASGDLSAAGAKQIYGDRNGLQATSLVVSGGSGRGGSGRNDKAIRTAYDAQRKDAMARLKEIDELDRGYGDLVKSGLANYESQLDALKADRSYDAALRADADRAAALWNKNKPQTLSLRATSRWMTNRV